MTANSGERLVPTDSYDIVQKETHKSFSKACEDLASFCVVLLARVRAGADFKERYRARSFEVKDHRIWLHLVRTHRQDWYGHATSRSLLRALSGKVRHPYKVVAEYDAAIEIAVTLAGMDLDLKGKYFLGFLQNRYSNPNVVLDFDESPMSAMMAGHRREIDFGESIAFLDIDQSILRSSLRGERAEAIEPHRCRKTPSAQRPQRDLPVKRTSRHVR
jgi:hypothetical protein